jgi:hypothetical protein
MQDVAATNPNAGTKTSKRLPAETKSALCYTLKSAYYAHVHRMHKHSGLQSEVKGLNTSFQCIVTVDFLLQRPPIEFEPQVLRPLNDLLQEHIKMRSLLKNGHQHGIAYLHVIFPRYVPSTYRSTSLCRVIQRSFHSLIEHVTSSHFISRRTSNHERHKTSNVQHHSNCKNFAFFTKLTGSSD